MPRIINFQKIGLIEEGFLSIASHLSEIQFPIKRVFWTYGTPTNITRGGHAHYKTEMILIPVCGSIEVRTMSLAGGEEIFILDDPNFGLHLCPMEWHEMIYTIDAVQLALCSTLYDESDYIRSFEKFKEIINSK